MTLFRGKYRIESARKPHWDYAARGCYLVTICTNHKRIYFGRVRNGAVDFSPIGQFADSCWREIPSHHPNVEIDEFTVMPNHVHGIIVLTGPEQKAVLRKRGAIKRIAELSAVHPKRGSLGAVVGSFKSAVTNWCGMQHLDFGWQPGFHDRIIRGKNSLNAVRKYIRENPANWELDALYMA